MINEQNFVCVIYDENYYYYDEFSQLTRDENYKIVLTQYNKKILYDFDNYIVKLDMSNFDNDKRFDIILNKKFNDELTKRKRIN